MRVDLKLFTLFLVGCLSGLNAIDLPQFYRAPFFQESFSTAYGKYTTGLSVRYGHGSTRNAWNGHNETVPLLSGQGYMDITNLGSWVDSPDGIIDPVNDKTMTQYWGGANYHPLVDNPIFPPDYKTNPIYKDLGVNETDGLIEYKGRFEIDEWDFTLQQDILWGFFIQVYLPYRDLKINKIAYKNLGQPQLIGADTGSTVVNVDNFMSKEAGGVLNNVLGLKDFSAWQKPWHESGIGDLLLSAGWHGSGDPQSPVFKRLSAEVQIGVLIPTSGKKDLSKPFALPVGTSDSTAIDGRISAYVQVFDFIGVGAQGGGLVFFSQERDLRVKTDRDQNGWIMLEKSFGKVDYGSQWDVCAFAQLGFKGFNAKVGASYIHQEDTVLTMHDHDLLKSYKEQKLNPVGSNPALGPVYPEFISANSIVNSDKTLKSWEFYTLHLTAGYSLELKSVCPTIYVEYDYPFYGKNTFKTDMFGGSLSLQVKLSF